jgi:hypothetical protein
MKENRGLLEGGLARLMRNKRYIFWFWLLNLTLAEFATTSFRRNAHAILDHSLYAQNLANGFHLSTFFEMLSMPEFPRMNSMTFPALYFAFVFFLFTAIFLPGVFAGYVSQYRLPREDFFRACGRNLWRFIRLMIVAAIVMGIIAGLLFAANGAVVKKAGESTNEMLPFELQMIGLAIIFLIMTTLRIWFDLAEADIVLNDQGAVRRSVAAGFRHTVRSFGRLLGTYALTTLVAAMVLVGGLLIWLEFVPAHGILRAFIVGQIILFLLLIPRFWQRGIAVAYWQQRMLVPVVRTQSAVEASAPVVAAPVEPTSSPVIPAAPTETREAGPAMSS